MLVLEQGIDVTNNHGAGSKNKKVINSGGTAHSRIFMRPEKKLFNQWVPKSFESWLPEIKREQKCYH